MTVSEFEKMYEVATDDEAVVLDDLRRRAGITWECTCQPGGWTNAVGPAASVDFCDRCGARRPEAGPCEDGLCGTGSDWPTCGVGCVCACHDIAAALAESATLDARAEAMAREGDA
jgi:hypothetical protein